MRAVIPDGGSFDPLKLEPAGYLTHRRFLLSRRPYAAAPSVDTSSAEVDGGCGKDDDGSEKHAEEDPLADTVIPGAPDEITEPSGLGRYAEPGEGQPHISPPTNTGDLVGG